MTWWKRRCAHSDIRPIHGDEVIFATPKYSRLQCRTCGRYLDGPVKLAVPRATGDSA